MGKRSFEEATLVSVGVQGSDARFGRRLGGDEQAERPGIAHWRCNLTALSQEHNLYCVAYAADIYLYVPQYPTQAIAPTPALIVPSLPSRPGLPGSVDPRHPHSINHLVVQRLGHEEVVAAVRDDGDVDAFLLRHLLHAIARRAQVDPSMGPVGDEVKPFFHANVGQSAWGLAIHSQARIMAVSANTHNITIFKFGLARDADGEDAVARADAAPAQNRDDVTVEIINGSTNIPHVAFCNTGDDPTGRWLLTTDIGGNCRSFDLHAMQPHQTFRFGPASSYLQSHDRLNSGWGMFFLDRKSFIPEESIEAALGLNEGEQLPGVQSNPAVWDISQAASHAPRCIDKFSASKSLRHQRGRRDASSATSDNTSQSSRQPAPSPLPSEGNATSSEHEGTSMGTDDDDDNDDLDDEQTDDSGESAYMADLDFEDEGTEDVISFSSMYSGRRIYGNTPRAAYPQRSICDDLPCPILHTSVRNVYLLQPPAKGRSADGPFEPPTVGFTNALHQFVQSEHAWLNAFERLNMHCYIPAIGIIVLASQKGRVMIIALTKVSKRAFYPDEMKDGRIENKTNYGMRIEHIFPSRNQEFRRQRPFQPLHGIAASPIQQGSGRTAEQQRRWRLMLMYADHSILSYEISRRRSTDSAVDIGSVVV